MPITEKQRELRRKHLGGSDIPVLLGLSRFKTPYDLYLDKTGQVEQSDEQSEAMLAGTLFEDGVIQYAEQTLGKITRNQYRSAKDLPIACDIDGVVKDSDEPVEIKVEGLFWKLRDGWGEEGTDNVPYDVIVQAHAHMLCQEASVCHIAAFLGGVGFRLYKIDRDEELIDIIVKKANYFWNNCVLADTPPDDSMPSIDTLKHVIREEGKAIEIDNVLADTFFTLNQIAKEAEKKADAAKAALIASLGDAEIGSCRDYQVVYKNVTQNRLDSKALKADMPDIAKKYTNQNSYRKLTVKEIKGE